MPKTKLQKDYLAYLESKKLSDVTKKYKRVILYCSELKRKKGGSNNSLDSIVKLASRIYGFEELLKQTRVKQKIELFNPDYSYEKNILNEKLLDYVKKQIRIRRKNKRIFFGENLLNAYCDVIFLATNLDDNRENNIRPEILRNPKTGKNLEFDIYFGEIKFALEFQGEQHYIKDEIIEHDKLKLDLSRVNCIMLSPINPIQMPDENLLKLIANTAKDFYKMSDTDGNLKANVNAKYKILFKVIQRYDLAEKLYHDVLDYLDCMTRKYIERIKRYSPISTTQNAPRIAEESEDKNIDELKRQIPKVYRDIKTAKKQRNVETC